MKLPTILIINGLLQYQTMLPVPMPTPTSGIVSDLREIGFRVIEDTHLLWAHNDEEPVVVIGHSRGGATALRFAEKQKREVKYNPMVITFDAAPPMRCPVARCINFQSKEYRLLPVPGAQNIDADMPFMPVVSHSLMPLSPHVRARVKRLVMPYARPDR
jgi:pimeloyl-ACP methyl ester carboxylesterase